MEWGAETGWEPPRVVADRLSTQGMLELVDPGVTGIDEWEDIVSSAILWGRSMQKKLLQAAKNSDYLRHVRKWRAAFWTQKRKSYRSVMSKGGAPYMLTLKHPVTGKQEHSEGVVLGERDFFKIGSKNF